MEQPRLSRPEPWRFFFSNHRGCAVRRENAPFTGIAKVAPSSAASNFSPVGCWVDVMLGDIGIAEVSVFLILLWVSAAAVIAAVALYRLHFRKAFAIAAYSALISLALAVWAYFSIWGYVWAAGF